MWNVNLIISCPLKDHKDGLIIARGSPTYLSNIWGEKPSILDMINIQFAPYVSSFSVPCLQSCSLFGFNLKGFEMRMITVLVPIT